MFNFKLSPLKSPFTNRISDRQTDRWTDRPRANFTYSLLYVCSVRNKLNSLQQTHMSVHSTTFHIVICLNSNMSVYCNNVDIFFQLIQPKEKATI